MCESMLWFSSRKEPPSVKGPSVIEKPHTSRKQEIGNFPVVILTNFGHDAKNLKSRFLDLSPDKGKSQTNNWDNHKGTNGGNRQKM